MSSTIITALEISGIGLLGVFLFMTIFYLVLIGIDKLFPYEKKPKEPAIPSNQSYHPVDFDNDEFE